MSPPFKNPESAPDQQLDESFFFHSAFPLKMPNHFELFNSYLPVYLPSTVLAGIVSPVFHIPLPAPYTSKEKVNVKYLMWFPLQNSLIPGAQKYKDQDPKHS